MKKSSKPGTIYKIPLKEGAMFSYAKLVQRFVFKFYNIYTKKELGKEQIIMAETLFCTYVHKYVFTKSMWEPVFFDEIKQEESSPLFFKQDIQNKNLCWIVDVTGKEVPAKPQDCVELERLAVWDFEYIEERLLDYFEGRKNKHVEFMKVKL
jgi:Immunity protein 26